MNQHAHSPYDLSVCDREQIHVPGAIQPQGVLLGLSGSALTISCVSQNCDALLALPPAALLGQRLSAALGEGLDAAVREAANRWRVSPTHAASFLWQRAESSGGFWCSVHRSDETLVLELEPESNSASTVDTLLEQVLPKMDSVRAERALTPKLAAAAQMLRELTGYDRVMIYRFSPDWHGKVIAEARRTDLEPYLGLHYPATDIPVQARRLYTLSPTRVIVDIDDTPAPLLPPQGPDTAAPLDLSRSLLRSVSPVHIEYLRNMGVRATLTASLLCDGQLWGLIACHHCTPRAISGPLRELIGALAHDLATQIGLSSALAARDERARLQACRERALAAVRDGTRLAELLSGPLQSDLLGALGADGIALLQGEEVVTAGKTPSAQRIRNVARQLGRTEAHNSGKLFVTDCLSRHLPDAQDLADTAAGVLVMPLDGGAGLQLLGFRGEQRQQVTWAGEPHKSATPDADGRLSPRKSFAAWRETVRLQAQRWSEEELASARELAALIDIELRRVAEQAAVDSDAWLRSLLDNTPAVVFIKDLDGRYLLVNRSCEDLLGKTDAELRGRRPDEVLAPATAAKFIANDRAVISSADTHIVEETIDAPDGPRLMLSTQFPLLDAEQRVTAIAGISVDITERRHAEHARDMALAEYRMLRESERRFRVMADELPLMVWVHDVTGDCTLVNKAGCSFLGAPEERLLGAGFIDYLHPDDRDAYSAKLSAAMAERRPEQGRCRARRADGAWRWIESFARPVFDADGTYVGIVGTSLDITERKAAEDALRDSHQALHRHAEQLSRLTSALTLAEQRERERLAKLLHDHLQQLLVGAVFGIERLRRRLNGAALPDGAEDILISIRRLLQEAIDSARTLVSDLSPPILQEGGFGPALEWLARRMEDTHQLAVALWLDDLDIDAELQRPDVRSVMFEAVREALFNIVKHTDCDSAQVRLSRDDQGRLCIEVRDHGAGFDMAQLDSGQHNGTGFGIVALRERLRCLGGALHIDTGADCGTTVTLVAPARDAVAPVGAPTDSTSAQAAEPTSGSTSAGSAETAAHPDMGSGDKVRVLLVDDHAMMRQGLRALLAEEHGLTLVGEASNGVEALELVASLHPQLVLMDYSMPHMDGLEATKRIRGQWPEVCVIGLSMYQEADRAAAMLQAGACAYVDKTAGADALLTAIRNSRPFCEAGGVVQDTAVACAEGPG